MVALVAPAKKTEPTVRIEESDFYEAWAVALESGEFRQCQQEYHYGDAFCALGVGLEIARRAEPDRYEWQEMLFVPELHCLVDTHTGQSCHYNALTPYIGDDRGKRLKIAELNDSGVPFPELANHIRSLRS